MLWYIQESPRRRFKFSQSSRQSHRPPRSRESAHRLAGQSAVIVAGPRQHGDWNAPNELQPATPARQLQQDIGAGQPDEAHPWEPSQQKPQRIDRVARTPTASIPLAMTRRPSAMQSCGREPLSNGAMPHCGFKGLPGDTSSQTWSSCNRRRATVDDVSMTCMCRIERTSQ